MSSSRFVTIALTTIGVLLVVLLVAKFTVFSFFQMEGNSMVDTMQDRALLFVNKLDTTPDRGDVIVFKAPFDEDGRIYLKRVVGVPGDIVVIRDGSVFLATEDGETELSEPYLNERNKGHTYGHGPNDGDESEISFTVQNDQYFVLGDNRQGSMDSRSFHDGVGTPAPFIPAAYVVGTVWFY